MKNKKPLAYWQVLTSAILMMLELDFGIDIDYLFEENENKNKEGGTK